jgi:hypothetical protein
MFQRKPLLSAAIVLMALSIVWASSLAPAHAQVDATSTPTPGRWVTVVAPNGGETLFTGQVYRISWQSSPNIDKVSIGYKSCASCLNWIATNIPNTGYYDWNVNVGNTANTEFTIYLIGYETGVGSTTDESDASFTVVQEPTPVPTASRWLTVTSPNGGETLIVGDVFPIAWQSSSNIDKVSIGYKACPSCLDWIATNIPNDGVYDWTVFVGNTTNTQFTIEIIGYETGYGSVTDTSDAPFTVLQPPTPTPLPTGTPLPTATPSITPNPQLDTPVLLYPINGQRIRFVHASFDWSSVTGATSYELEVSASPTFSYPLIDVQTAQSEYSYPDKLPRRTTLYWRVRALGYVQSSAWATDMFYVR